MIDEAFTWLIGSAWRPSLRLRYGMASMQNARGASAGPNPAHLQNGLPVTDTITGRLFLCLKRQSAFFNPKQTIEVTILAKRYQQIKRMPRKMRRAMRRETQMPRSVNLPAVMSRADSADMRIKTASIFKAQWINLKKGTGSLRNRSEIFSDTITQELHKTKAAFMFFIKPLFCKLLILLVPKEGVEPSCPRGARDFESRASASSATSAR